MRTVAVEITEAHLKQIETAAGYGLTVTMIASLIGVSRSTFYEYATADERIKTALAGGRAKAALIVGGALFNQAKSGNVQAIRWYETTRLGMKPADKSLEDDELEPLALDNLEDEELLLLEKLLSKADANSGAIDGEFTEINGEDEPDSAEAHDGKMQT